MTFHSPAKINLWLRILGKRPDGFHEVQTRLCRLALGDTVEIEHRGKAQADLGAFTQPISYIGLPVLTAPVNRPGQLPIGVQIIASGIENLVSVFLASHVELF